MLILNAIGESDWDNR